MAKYSKRHYGKAEWRLRNPKLIVQHYTVTPTAQAAFNTFAANQRDPELYELPGVCSHFLIDTDGTIYRLVATTIRCRHVIGLNHVAIGIEHVGNSDGEVLGRAAQLNASLKLTTYLRCTYGIGVKNVIGHAESLSSPYYKELVKSARGMTHGDFARRSMQGYRRQLAGLGAC